jgi:hypothetical protein
VLKLQNSLADSRFSSVIDWQRCYMVMRMCQMATNCRQDCRHNENWPLFRKKSGQFDFSLVTGRGLEPRT